LKLILAKCSHYLPQQQKHKYEIKQWRQKYLWKEGAEKFGMKRQFFFIASLEILHRADFRRQWHLTK